MSRRLITLDWSRYAPRLLRQLPPPDEDDIKYFIIRDNKAYTEDNVLIYNIFVFRIPIEFAEYNARCYFSKFGKVTEVKLEEDKNPYKRGKMGIVGFAEPESACSVLRKKHHYIQGSLIGVIECDSWKQPNADKTCGPMKNDDDVASTSKGSSKDVIATNDGVHMLLLNDDCLETIFGYLNLKEQVRMARVCKRFQDFFQMICNRKFKNFDLSNISEMTLWEIRDVFRFAGGNMTSITGTVPYKNRDRIVKIIRKCCGKLKRLQLENTDMGHECLTKLFCSSQKLQTLILRNCCLDDYSIRTISHLNSLETLDLAGSRQLTGKYINKFVQLKVLNLHDCCNIETSNLMDICKSLPNLRSLDIRLCHRLEATLFDVMVEQCKELESLKLSCAEFLYERVAFLPRLKQLEVLWSSSYRTAQKRLLAELVAHKADQLEVLKIVSKDTLSVQHIALISELRQLKTLFVADNRLVNDNALIKFCKLQQLEDLTIEGCSNITNQRLLKLVQSCQRLSRLNIQFCKQITIEFLQEAISFLKDSEKRKTPLVLKVFGTSIDYHEGTAIVQGI